MKELKERTILVNSGLDIGCYNLFIPTKVILPHYKYIWKNSFKIQNLGTKVFFANIGWWTENEESREKYWKQIEL